MQLKDLPAFKRREYAYGAPHLKVAMRDSSELHLSTAKPSELQEAARQNPGLAMIPGIGLSLFNPQLGSAVMAGTQLFIDPTLNGLRDAGLTMAAGTLGPLAGRGASALVGRGVQGMAGNIARYFAGNMADAAVQYPLDRLQGFSPTQAGNAFQLGVLNPGLAPLGYMSSGTAGSGAPLIDRHVQAREKELSQQLGGERRPAVSGLPPGRGLNASGGITLSEWDSPSVRKPPTDTNAGTGVTMTHGPIEIKRRPAPAQQPATSNPQGRPQPVKEHYKPAKGHR